MNVNKFFALARLEEHELFNLSVKYFNVLYPKVVVDKYKTYIYAQGNSSVCLVAHLDTVFQNPPSRFLTRKLKSHILSSKQGLGADDRAGVYAIYEILSQGHRPSIILTTGEEIGAVGASMMLEDYPEIPIKTSCLIELDRRGKNDSIYYMCGNTKFEEFINQFGFRTTEGIFSDVALLGPTWDIAAVNLSVGYYKEHSYQEYLNTKHLDLTINKVCDIIQSEPEFFDYQEIVYNIPWTKCAFCTTGNCQNCSYLDSMMEGAWHGRERQYSQGRDYY